MIFKKAAAIGAAFFFSAVAAGFSAEPGRTVLPGHVPALVSRLVPEGRLPATNQLALAISLPPRNQAGLDELMAQLYDPRSTNYHKYLTPEEFTARFGPTEQEYQAVISFARASGLTVTATYPNRVLVDVSGSVATVEKTFNVTLRVYRHPVEDRDFFAPDSEPSIATNLPILHISGLDNFTIPRPAVFKKKLLPGDSSGVTPASGTGSGPIGLFMGNDFRAAYVPGTVLNGTGQTVGLFELDGYFTNDITTYEGDAGLPNITLTNVLIDGYNGSAGGNNLEVALDIEMAIDMATNLSRVIVYEGQNGGNIVDFLNRIATDNLARQVSSSWLIGDNPGFDTAYQQMALQGQSFFQAAGDDGAFYPGIPQSADDTNITLVGGTTLTTTGPGGAWLSEKVWNWNSTGQGTNGGGGGISLNNVAIPSWQTNLNMTTNQGSTTLRNVPDVALTADNIFVVANNGNGYFVGGTSAAAPLWAGYTALINQQAAVFGSPPVGFINPAIYAIGQGTNYPVNFHDITTGNNTNKTVGNNYFAVRGYDLCTGWGTPNGINLINALAIPGALLVTPGTGFTAIGPVGGPFNVTAQNFTLSNQAAASLNWSIVSTSVWLNIAPVSGTLAGAGQTTVVAGLNSAANNLAAGIYSSTVFFTNQTSGTVQNRQFTLSTGQSIIQNGGFETGDLTGWTLNGDGIVGGGLYDGVVSAATFKQHYGTNFIHSGTYGMALGDTSLAYLSQTVPTLPGANYLISFWVNNHTGDTPNQFLVDWNTNAAATNMLFNATNIGLLNWTNMLFIVTAPGTNATLQFGALNVNDYFGLDDISVTPISPPVLSMQPANLTVLSGSNAVFSATASGSIPLVYQWRKNGTNISNGAGISGVTTSVLTLTAVTTNSTANYTLFVTNIFGVVTSSVAALTVVLPPAVASSSVTNRTLQCGSNNPVFTVTAAGTLPLNYQWSLDGAPVANATNNSFSLTNLHLPNHTVSVAVTNLYGALASNAVLTVQDTIAPAITLNGGNPIFVELGGAFTDPGATATDLCAGAVGVVVSGVVNTNAVSTNTVFYTAGDGDGNTNTITRTVIVRDTTPPTILWSFTNLVLAANTNCSAPMPVVTGTNFILATDLSGALTITQSPTNNFLLPVGTNPIVITVKDASGNAAFSTNTIVVQDQTPPVISGQPQSVTNVIGATVNFNVAATACTPQVYQWSFGSSSLTGQTNSALTLTNIGLASAGNYSVVVSASGGSTTSAVAVLTVNLHATTVALASTENPSGFKDNLNFTAAVTPTNATGTVQFFTNGAAFDAEILVSGQTASTNLSSLPRGTNVITAVYSGDANDLPSTNLLLQIVTNHPPAATPAFYTRGAGTVLDIATTDLATHWSDVDGDTVSLAAIGVSSNGVTVADNAGTLVYSNANNVADQFVCTISDGFGGTNFQAVNIAVVFPSITSVVSDGAGSITLNLTGAPGYTYLLETTTNLFSAGNWLPIATNTLGTNSVWQFTDTSAINFPQQFYQLKLAQ